MLTPALTNSLKFEIEELCMKPNMYSEDYMFYTNSRDLEIIDFKDPDRFHWASIKQKIVDDEKVEYCTGYFAYSIDFATKSVYDIAMMSFTKMNVQFMYDVYCKLIELMSTFNRLEFECISGNPAMKTYDKFVAKYNGQKIVLHNCIMDIHGKLHDKIIYEVLSK